MERLAYNDIARAQAGALRRGGRRDLCPAHPPQSQCASLGMPARPAYTGAALSHASWHAAGDNIERMRAVEGRPERSTHKSWQAPGRKSESACGRRKGGL